MRRASIPLALVVVLVLTGGAVSAEPANPRQVPGWFGLPVLGTPAALSQAANAGVEDVELPIGLEPRTYWGVIGGVAPNWWVPSAFKLIFDADEIAMEGSEFRIGFVRGTSLKGDWGLSYVHKTVKDGSQLARNVGSDCEQCGSFFTTSDVAMKGVEVHKFAPFGTITRRLLIGVNVAAGVAVLRGTVRELTVSSSAPDGMTGVTQDVEADIIFAPGVKEVFVPLGKFELAVAVVFSPELNIRMSGGFNMPGTTRFNVSVLYLFGAR